MPRDRELPLELPNESLTGQIVHFQFKKGQSDIVVLIKSAFKGANTEYPGGYVGQVVAYDFVAYDFAMGSKSLFLIASSIFALVDETSSISIKILLPHIANYQILTRRELPLYIGYKFTSPLLAELIRGDHE